MDEYVGGIGTNGPTHGKPLGPALEPVGMLQEGWARIGMESLHKPRQRQVATAAYES